MLSAVFNSHGCKIVENDREFNCAEQMIQKLKAEECGDIRVFAEIGLMQEPVLVKKRAKGIALPNGECPWKTGISLSYNAKSTASKI